LVFYVPIRHNQYPDFDELAIKRYAVPFLSDMTLEIEDRRAQLGRRAALLFVAGRGKFELR
jgi:hypothetical protein